MPIGSDRRRTSIQGTVMRLSLILAGLVLSASSSGRAIAAEERSKTFELPPVAPNSPTPTTPRHFTGVTFRGNHVIPTSTLLAVARLYLERDLDSARIEQLRIALTRLYTDRGYINSGVMLDSKDPYAEGMRFFEPKSEPQPLLLQAHDCQACTEVFYAFA